MSWGNFILVLLIVYLLYYAGNIIYDLFIRRGTGYVTDDSSNLMDVSGLVDESAADAEIIPIHSFNDTDEAEDDGEEGAVKNNVSLEKKSEVKKKLPEQKVTEDNINKYDNIINDIKDQGIEVSQFAATQTMMIFENV